jgi:hypothetical protein
VKAYRSFSKCDGEGDVDIVNVVSTGIGNYGQSPIFWAIIECRDDMVRLLIELGANLLIVNNKGQTPCSMAPSHVSEDTCNFMYDVERRQIEAGGTFVNYRESHGDGRMYGDLDPRFEIDEVNYGEDIVEDLARYQRNVEKFNDRMLCG